MKTELNMNIHFRFGLKLTAGLHLSWQRFQLWEWFRKSLQRRLVLHCWSIRLVLKGGFPQMHSEWGWIGVALAIFWFVRRLHTPSGFQQLFTPRWRSGRSGFLTLSSN